MMVRCITPVLRKWDRFIWTFGVIWVLVISRFNPNVLRCEHSLSKKTINDG